jgi:hypothetical protein
MSGTLQTIASIVTALAPVVGVDAPDTVEIPGSRNVMANWPTGELRVDCDWLDGMRLTCDELHALVAHELSHFKNREYYFSFTVEANHLSEFRADAMAATLGYAEALISLIQKISKVPPDRESWSHPSHNQRIAALKKLKGGEA